MNVSKISKTISIVDVQISEVSRGDGRNNAGISIGNYTNYPGVQPIGACQLEFLTALVTVIACSKNGVRWHNSGILKEQLNS